jgi:hypothetical protein
MGQNSYLNKEKWQKQGTRASTRKAKNTGWGSSDGVMGTNFEAYFPRITMSRASMTMLTSRGRLNSPYDIMIFIDISRESTTMLISRGRRNLRKLWCLKG